MNVPLVVLSAARDLPPGDDWLRPMERRVLRRFRAPKRRRDFRLGRLAARRALFMLAGYERVPDPGCFEVRPARSGAPLAFRDGRRLEVTLSISHSDGWASAAVQRGSGPLGCDLERIEPRSRYFLEDYLTPREQTFVADGPASQRPLRATLLWSAKEAILKALGEGLRLAPATVEVVPATEAPSAAGWRRFSVTAPPAAARLHGFWRSAGGAVLTLAGGPDEPRLVASV